MHCGLITNDERPKIFDAPLMPIFIKGHRACRWPFSLKRRPILWLYIGTTISLLNYPTYKTKNRWRTVDAEFQNGSGSVSLAPLPIKPANTTSMNNLNQLSCRLPMIQDWEQLTLGWLSFCHGIIHNMLLFNLAWYIIIGVVAAFVPSSCTFSFINRLFFNNTYKYILYNIH